MLEESLTLGPGERLVENGEVVAFRRARLSPRLLDRLRRGEFRVSEEIDLHGLTAVQARRALRAFMAEAMREDRRCIRIVHGKGKGSGPRGPVNVEPLPGLGAIIVTGNTPALINTIVGGDYLINNAIYSEEEVPTVVNLNDAEEWHLIVGTSHHGGTEGHPFHIHVNAFEVISINGVMQPPGTIQDTVWVGVGQTVVVRMRFKQWTGKSVYHCHILGHEDSGMMAIIRVTPAKQF